MNKEKISSVLDKLINAPAVANGKDKKVDFLGNGYILGDNIFIPLNKAAAKIELQSFHSILKISILTLQNGFVAAHTCLDRHIHTDFHIVEMDMVNGFVEWGGIYAPDNDFYIKLKEEINQFIRAFYS